jgi:UDP-glucose 4-epimerase
MRVLVTGGAGFIGSHLVRALLARGDEVRVLDDLSSGRRERLADVLDRVDLRVGDVRDRLAVAAAVDGCRAVSHQAAIVSVPRSIADPLETVEVNLVGTARVLAAAIGAGAERFVLASSAAVYGDAPGGARDEDDRLDPLSPYAVSKLAAEDLVALASRRHGLVGVSLRYFNVYGAGQAADSAYAAVVPRFAADVALGRPPIVHGDGEQTRDLCHVTDVARANLAALDAPAATAGEVFNVGVGRATSVNELAAALVRLSGRALAPRHDEPRPGDVRHSLAAVERARRALGFSALVSLEEGLAGVLASLQP